MQCLKCQFENPEGIKFCVECGNKLETICPKCGFSNSPNFKFCGECGHSFIVSSEPPQKELSFDEKLDKIQKYLPKGLTKKILAQKDRIEGERKQVTVMFCDMEGFTPLVEQQGAETAYSIMDQVYELLIHKVHDYEGTINEMTGDGIMALFGAPIALEDAPQRAIRSAYAIHREMARFNDRLKEERKGVPPLKMRIGIHSGPVVVGTLGNNLRVEFKAVGETVNLASRMEGLSEPGTIYVSNDTFKLTEGLFRFEALGDKHVKGKEAPVAVYRVIAPSTRKTRFDVNAERGLTPFVGRNRELELLLDSLERVKGGVGQAFSIIGEAGIGKSRFLYELRKAIINEDITFLEGKCLSYGKGIPYHPISDILKGNFEIGEDDADDKIREKVKNSLNALNAEEAMTLPYLLEILGVKDSGIDRIPMSSEGRKDRIIEAVKQIVLKGSQVRPLVIAIEDLHWADQSTEEALKLILEAVPGARVLIIFTYRPEFVHTWGGRSYHNQITLNRLSNREALLMVPNLLGGTDVIDTELQGLILNKTEGVPFFIEEFIKSFKDLNIIVKRDNKYYLSKEIDVITIPATIQDVIMARVDALPDEAKEVLQVGSVIEREFNFELISMIAGYSERELLSHLSVLKNSELLYERGIFPHSIYVFKHAFTREVVYESILAKRKKRLHGNIGKTIEDLYQETIDEYYEILAEHYIASEIYDKAAEYSKLAGKRAEKAGALADAIRCSKKGIASLEKLSITDEVQSKIVDARTTLGLYQFQMFYFSDAKEAIDPIIKFAIGSDYKRRIAQIYTILGAYNFWCEEDITEAINNLELALKIAHETNDIVSLFFANQYLGIVRASNSEFKKAVKHFNVALDINLTRNAIWGVSAVKSTLSYWGYNYQGKVDIAFQTSQEALSMAEESGDIYSKAAAYGTHGYSCFYTGRFNEAEQNLLSAVDFCEKIGLFNWEVTDLFILATVYLELENYQGAEKYYAKALELSDYTDIQPSVLNLIKIQLSLAKCMNNQENIDMKTIYSLSAANKLKIQEGWIRRSVGQILLNINDKHLSDAEKWIKGAIKEDRQIRARWNLGMDYAIYAEMFKRKGDQEKAKVKLGEAIEILNNCGAGGWVAKYEKEMAAFK
jgi:class 3 adenylate cyclase/tetratricopeptide (TPR) repeat protein